MERDREDRSRIPLYESDFLQDISIELGKCLGSIRRREKLGRLEFSISSTEDNDGEWECLDLIAWRSSEEYVQIVISERGAGNFVHRLPSHRKNDIGRYEGHIISVKGWTSAKIASLIRDSLMGENGYLELWRDLDVRLRH